MHAKFILTCKKLFSHFNLIYILRYHNLLKYRIFINLFFDNTDFFKFV
jgi:hypothetical protein